MTFEQWQRSLFLNLCNVLLRWPNLLSDNTKGRLSANYITPDLPEVLRVCSLFTVRSAASKKFDCWGFGKIPFVSGGQAINGITGLVNAPVRDIIRDIPCLTVSGFGEIALQLWPFAARGNGGSAIRLLVPSIDFSFSQLVWLSWRLHCETRSFNFGNQLSMRRLAALEISPDFENTVDSRWVLALLYQAQELGRAFQRKRLR